ncbi:hypothetical protein GCM10008949_30360 [Deinococcus humi]|nr:hypothetical protein GCM10008949_30360 [Deinococcus humi]
MRRVELGKSQADVAFESEVLTQTTVSELERGKYGPEDLTAARLSALARGLNWTVAELEAATGLNLGLSPASDDQMTVVLRPLPEGLQAAIDIYGKRFSDLLDPTWQQYMAKFRWREGQPEDAESWLDLYRDLSRAGIVPGEN